MLELLGVALGVIALAVGLYHVLEIRRALANLAVVRSSMSTQYLGKFPGFLANIVELVDGAEHDLVVFCDYPGYGEVSEPSTALEYQHALQRRKLAHVNIDFTFLNSDIRKKHIADQFAGSTWSDWRRDDEKREKMTRFLRSHAPLVAPESVTQQELVDALHDVDERLLCQPYLSPVRQIALHMPIFFWIADSRKAVFSIPTLAHGAFEHGFLTSDHALIHALLEMHERYKRSSNGS